MLPWSSGGDVMCKTRVSGIDSNRVCKGLAVRAACCCGSRLLASWVSGKSLAKSASSTGKFTVRTGGVKAVSVSQ